MQQLSPIEHELIEVIETLRETNPNLVSSIVKCLGTERLRFGSVTIIFYNGNLVTVEKRETFKE